MQAAADEKRNSDPEWPTPLMTRTFEAALGRHAPRPQDPMPGLDSNPRPEPSAGGARTPILPSPAALLTQNRPIRKQLRNTRPKLYALFIARRVRGRTEQPGLGRPRA